MKRLKYPSLLTILEIQLEALTKSFLDGIRDGAKSLRELTIQFSKVDATIETYKPLGTTASVPEESKEADQDGGHGLKRLTLINQLRSSQIPIAVILEMVLDLEPVLTTTGNGNALMFVPFDQLEYLALHKITITGEEGTAAFIKYL